MTRHELNEAAKPLGERKIPANVSKDRGMTIEEIKEWMSEQEATMMEHQIPPKSHEAIRSLLAEVEPEPQVWEGKVSDISIRRIEIMMDENAPAIKGKRVEVRVLP